jgi:hypothetical protein
MSESETIPKLVLHTVYTFYSSNAVIFVFVFCELKECVKNPIKFRFGNLMSFKCAPILLIILRQHLCTVICWYAVHQINAFKHIRYDRIEYRNSNTFGKNAIRIYSTVDTFKFEKFSCDTTRVSQDTSRQGGLIRKIFKFRGGGGKFLPWSPLWDF